MKTEKNRNFMGLVATIAFVALALIAGGVDLSEEKKLENANRNYNSLHR